ncbi:MAG: YesL family protein [Eubacteriales bacterium]|nr:YesL family protein [Eubacteriales bacterium]
MAGIFGLFDYTKDGPGIDPDAPPSPRIIVFFQVLGRKFWKLIQANLLFVVFNLLALPAMFIAAMFLFPTQLHEDVLLDLYFRLSIGFVLVCLPVITFGPAQAGFTYILRNFAREEHAFLWYDFKETAKKNIKQSLSVSIIDLAVIIVFGIALNYYLYYPNGGSLTSIAAGFVIILLVFFLMMHIYIYPMMITFNLKVSQIYKNAAIFALVSFFPNLLILLLCAVLILGTFIFNPYIGLLLYIFITNSAIGLIINFYAWPKLKKYIVDKLPENLKGDSSVIQGSDSPDVQE